MRPTLTLMRDAREFGARAEEFLAATPRRNVLATVLLDAVRGRYADDGRPLFACQEDPETRELVAVALRTPPLPLLAAGFDDPTAANGLVAAWLDEEPELPGVGAEPGTARAIAAAYAERTGAEVQLEVREAMHSLTSVIDPPPPASGRLRFAEPADRELLIDWERAFHGETGIGHGEYAQRTVDRRLEKRTQFVWEDGHTPVSTVGVNPPIAGTVRIGPVYTPPEHRGRGYATSAVAAVSRAMLAGPARSCMLFTDLDNPTSNRIYASIGYVRFADWEQHRFRLPSDRSRR